MAARVPSWPVLVAIGVAGGFFAALFGVGGGIIVVPLLIAAGGFGPHEATGTSLAVIGLTALFAVAGFGVLGRVDWGHAALVGIPALAGVLAGTALQQRISSRALTLLFSVFILAVAIRLFLE